MPTTSNNPRIPLTTTDLFQEIEDIADNMKDFLNQIIRDKKTARIKLLAVELRKLLNPSERGGSVLERAEEVFRITLKFTVSTLPPPNTKEVGLCDYIHGLAFALSGRRVERLDIIKLVADEKGAHTDPTADILHTQSKGIILPIGNPARDQLFFEQNQTYIISIAKTVLEVVKNQIIITRFAATS